MSKARSVAIAATGFLMATAVASADQRFVHKSGTAPLGSTTCGANSNTADATNGPCNTVQQAYNNAATAGGTARLIIISNGTFVETVTMNHTTGNSEIRISGDVNPAISSPDAATNAINVAVGNNHVRLFDVRIVAGSGGAATGMGINVTSARTVELNRVEMRGFSGIGLNFTPTGSPSGSSDLFVTDSIIANMNGTCVLIKPTAQRANGAIKNTRINNCGNIGLRSDASATSAADQFVRVLLSQSIVSSVTNAAVSSVGPGPGTARVLIENSDVMNSGGGINANGANAQLVLNAATLVGHTSAVNTAASGQVFSYGNSVIHFNTANGVTPTLLDLK